jgi:small subunit ribosomal protein S17
MPETPEEEIVETEEAAAPETDAPASDAPAVPAGQAAAVLPPKERRQQARAQKAAKRPVRGPQTPEERQAERVAERARKAGLRGAERARSRAKAKAAVTHTEATAAREHVPGAQKTRQGIVMSDKADKTITVRIDIARRHRRYQKIVHVSRTLHVHDESNDAHVGDTVVVRESRPLSRTKRWRLIEVLERAK